MKRRFCAILAAAMMACCASASAACSALDSMDIPGMVGSLAGDDTGILIMRDNASAEQFNREVHKLLK